MKLVPFVLLLALASGCEVWDPRPGVRDFFWGMGDESVPDPHAEIRKKEYPTWPKEIREAVDERNVQVGMTRNQALVAVRLAENDIPKQMVESAADKVENWTLWKTSKSWTPGKILDMSRKMTITFRNGIVDQLVFHTGTGRKIVPASPKGGALPPPKPPALPRQL